MPDNGLRSSHTGERDSGSDATDQKTYQVILEQEVETALAELQRAPRGLLLSGLSAGLDIGFSVLALGIVVTMAYGVVPEPVFEILQALAYGIGFVIVVLGRSELFTEHTTLAVLPLLGGRATVRQVGRLWALVYVSNIAGTIVFAGILAIIGPAMDSVTVAALGHIADGIIDHPDWVVLISAVVAGWMMGLTSWLVTAGTETISKIFLVWMITGLIGLAHLHHSIVGSVELWSAFFVGEAKLGDCLRVLGEMTIGNIVGGVVFVAVLKHAHASSGKRQ